MQEGRIILSARIRTGVISDKQLKAALQIQIRNQIFNKIKILNVTS